METHHDLSSVLNPPPLAALSGRQLAQLHNAELYRLLDALFAWASDGRANGAQQPRTTMEKLSSSEHAKLYIYWERDQHNASTLLGYVRVDRKRLYLYDTHDEIHEGELLCVLDAFVCHSRQRSGIGRCLFDSVLRAEGAQPHEVALDCPTTELLGFLAHVYRLVCCVPQHTNFVVFQQLFAPRAGSSLSGALDSAHWRRGAKPLQLRHESSFSQHAPQQASSCISMPQALRRSDDSDDVDSTHAQRASQARTRKQQLLSSEPLW